MIKAPELEPRQVVAIVEKLIGYQDSGSVDSDQDSITIPYAGHFIASLEALFGAGNVASYNDVWKCLMNPPRVATAFDVAAATRAKLLSQVLVQCGLQLHSKAEALIELQPKEGANGQS